ncbi:serine hydrolase domain-containing protein [Bacillus sp. FJAT-28004]|uniref:serine hydrolase domain-containing protein n=1 Tax=Bacillus sp. FJAT-28004 TaxID=1679165 RepID=UPI0006B5DE17|nr:serine hydrolase domain-containing protein [Bacillus sp. FJAT-28004]
MNAENVKSTEQLQQKLNDHCNSLAQLGYLNGCVLVASEGRIILSKGYGMASFEHDVPNTPQTIFRIGSITKQFTAAAIVIMHELKLLNVEDPISMYLPSYPNGDKITIHHLLTHTSGIPNYTSLEDFVPKMRLVSSTEDIIARFADKPLLFEPGEKFDYSNSGYVLLTAIIEQISGRTYEDYIHHAISKPLGMINTGYDNAKKILKNRASGYEVWGDVVNAEFLEMTIPSGAGGMYSTIEDLYIWGLSLHSQRQISEKAYGSMTTPFKDTYGYGLFIYEEDIMGSLRKVIGHGGGINGFLTEMRHYKNEDLTIIVLSNLVTTQVGHISQQLARIAFGEEMKLPLSHTPIQLDFNQYTDLVGSYEVEGEPGSSFIITQEQEKFYLTQNKWFKFELCPYSAQVGELLFFLNGMEGKITYSETGSRAELTAELFGGVKKAVKSVNL